MNRRYFLKGAAASLTGIAVLPGFARALTPAKGWLTGFGRADGTFGVAAIGDDLSVTPILSSSLRLHGILRHPTRNEICAPARRPGSHLWVLTEDQRVLNIEAPENRHYFGHGIYSQNGDKLFLAENDFDNERGVIGVYDSNDGYKRLGEFSSNGVGPHELRLMPGGRHLAIANGGILTHPDLGRAKLNLDTMQPNLTLIDLQTLRPVERAQLPDRFHQLSLRHFDVTSTGEIVFGVQDQRKPYGERPMVGKWTPGQNPHLFSPPKKGWGVLNGYVGSIAIEQSGRIAVAVSPRGGTAVFWNIASGEEMGSYTAKDICGLASTDNANGFLITSGQGSVVTVRVKDTGPVLERTANHTMQFDNHCRRG